MIEIQGLTVRFGGVVALDHVSLHLTEPVIGLIGPNGAGKTTLINALSGFVPVAGGAIGVNGLDLLSLQPHARARWGLARSFQKVQVVPDLTVRDHLAAVLDTRFTPKSARNEDIARVLDFLDLASLADRKGADLNPFQARLTEIGKCLVGTPRLVLLDEPGGGLAEAETETLRRVIQRINHEFGAQVLLVDHDVALIRTVCSMTAVLDFGRLIAYGPTEAVMADEVVKTAYLGK
jgi:branched-chain amino acid transport system ATP-binding protein